MLLKMGICTRNMSSYECINKINFLHEVGISGYLIGLESCENRLLACDISTSVSLFIRIE